MWIIIVGRDIIVFNFLHYSCIYSLPLFPPPNFFFKSGFKLELISAWCEFRCARGCAHVFYTTFFQASFEIFVFVKFTILDCTDFFFFLVRGRNQPFQMLCFNIWSQKPKLGPTAWLWQNLDRILGWFPTFHFKKLTLICFFFSKIMSLVEIILITILVKSAESVI